jgi:hypothetical protein
VGTQNGVVTLDDNLVVSYKLNILSGCTPYYLPKALGNYVHTKTCTQMFIIALFIIAKTYAIKMSFDR